MPTTPPPPSTTDVAAQVAVVSGVDSNVFVTQRSDGSAARHPAAFVGLEGSYGLRRAGRLAEEIKDVRVFGRLQQYAPLGPSFEGREGRVGLAWLGATRLGWRTMVTTTSISTLGSVQAARGTDGAKVSFDPLSTRRTAWITSNAAVLAHQVSRAWLFARRVGVEIGGTVRDEVPGRAGSVHRGFDYIVGSTRTSLARRVSARTTVEGALRLDRMHTAYVLDRSATPRNVGPLDSVSATFTLGAVHARTRALTALGEAGVSLAVPRIGDPALVLPAVSAGLVHATTSWSASALAGFQYAFTDPRVGPGPASTVTLSLVGRPLGGAAHEDLYLIAEAAGQSTKVVAGTNDGARVDAGTASVEARYNLGQGFGLLCGYDFRFGRFTGPSAPPPFVRHVVFLGLSLAWSGEGRIAPMATLVRPTDPIPIGR
ncbi:MAG: hypothetical protein HYV09_24340 [Deltaproteobacteria bacterium]|nr:hypothetical protein [Deltaproteobacteria bacterium]